MLRRILAFLFTAAAFAAPKPAGIDFQRQIRPILSDNCFQCHGPDKNTRMAGLRLDLKDEVLAKRAAGAAIVPGKPNESPLYLRIAESNPAKLMPPAHSRKAITPPQKDLIRRWIEQGAPWTEHWSFIAPKRATAPAVKDARWARNPIDRFVLAKVEAAGLKPAPEADRRTLARRVALDLTGLPPTPADVEAFVKDRSPEAYDKLLEKYLGSERWGEHRARYWLDAARYADTHGIHVDNYREMWPYRDWVIKAFNRNLPFDQFTIEQVAGDLLPNRTLDQQIASGFHRCNVTTNEAGVIVEEVEAIYAKDRVDTTGTVFLGLTIGCATCHDHKFDPISQRDFYSLAAFFRNTTQNAMDGNIPDTPPIIVVPRAEDRARWQSLAADEEAARAAMAARRGSADSAFEKWLASAESRAIGAPLSGQVFALDAPVKIAKDKPAELPNVDAFDVSKPFAIATDFYFPKAEEPYVVAAQADPKDKGRGWSIEIGARVVNFRLVGDDGKQITIRAGHMEQLKPGSWNHFAVSYDGSGEQAGLALFLNGKAVPNQGGGDQNTKLTGRINSNTPLVLGKNLPEGEISEFRIFSRAISADEAELTRRWAEIRSGNRDALHLYFLLHHDDAYRGLADKMLAYAKERRAIRKRGAITHVMQERDDQKPFANILYRGMYDQPRDRVEPNTPSVLPPMPASLARNRLGLAKWLVDPSNPLTSRVTVNRFWQEIFGAGLVKSAEDFGSQGFAPANQELLDWLAVEFRESGWDTKKLFRLILSSATYRQSAAATPEKIEKDPDNTMLSRGPRFRMDAEMVRDYALASSGLLSPAIGGPSVKPYQPEGIWEAVAMLGSNTRFYKRDAGDNLYRRSLYTFWKRSAPPPSMEVFNAPTRESCSVRRERTNTPLQALLTMNDVQFVEAARELAGRAVASGSEADARFDFLSAHLASRPLTGKERDIVKKSYRDFLRYYDANPADAEKLLSQGERKPGAGGNKAMLAAMTMVANQLMNLDEVLNK